MNDQAEAGWATLVLAFFVWLWWELAEIWGRRCPRTTEVLMLKLTLVALGLYAISGSIRTIDNDTGEQAKDSAGNLIPDAPAIITDATIANAQGDFGSIVAPDPASPGGVFSYQAGVVDAVGEVHAHGTAADGTGSFDGSTQVTLIAGATPPPNTSQVLVIGLTAVVAPTS